MISFTHKNRRKIRCFLAVAFLLLSTLGNFSLPLTHQQFGQVAYAATTTTATSGNIPGSTTLTWTTSLNSDGTKTLTIGGYGELPSNTTGLANFWPWYNDSSITSINISTNLQNYSSSVNVSWAYLFANLPSLKTITGLSSLAGGSGVSDMSYLFANDPLLAGPLSLTNLQGPNLVSVKGAFQNDYALTGVTLGTNMGNTQHLLDMDNLFSGDKSLVSIDLVNGNTNGQLQAAPGAHAYGSFDGVDTSKVIISGFNDALKASYIKASNKIHIYIGQTWDPSLAYIQSVWENAAGLAAGTGPTTWAAANAAGASKVDEVDNGASTSITLPPSGSSTPLPGLNYLKNGVVQSSAPDGTPTAGKAFTAIYYLDTDKTKYYPVNVDIYAVPTIKLSKSSDTLKIGDSFNLASYVSSVTGYDGTSSSAAYSSKITDSAGNSVTSLDTSKAGSYTITYTVIGTGGQVLYNSDNKTPVTATLTVTVGNSVLPPTFTTPTIPTLYVGQTWNPNDYQASANFNGTTYSYPTSTSSGIYLSQTNTLPVDSSNHLTTAGSNYSLTYTLNGTGLTSGTTATLSNIVVKDNQASLSLSNNNLTIFKNQSFSSTDIQNIANAASYTNYDGTKTGLVVKEDSSQSQTVDSTKGGSTYSLVFDLYAADGTTPIVDKDGKNITATATVTVKNAASLSLSQDTLPLQLGQTFSAPTYLKTALSYDGTTDLTTSTLAGLSIKDSAGTTVTASQMSQKAGDYTVTYSLQDANGQVLTDNNNQPITASMKVTVASPSANFVLPFTGSHFTTWSILVLSIFLLLAAAFLKFKPVK